MIMLKEKKNKTQENWYTENMHLKLFSTHLQ